MFLSIQDEIAIVLCYLDAFEGDLILYDKQELKYKDHMNSVGINYINTEHLEKLTLGQLLYWHKYDKFSKDELYDMM
jgi:hypothetical protein